MTQTSDERPVETPEPVHPHAGEEATVNSLLEEGPRGPQGRIAMAAAGIDVDERFPVDGAGGDGAADGDRADGGALAAPTESTNAAERSGVREQVLSADVTQEFLGRWDNLQTSFVEDPAQSVRNADALMQDVARAQLAAITERRDSLRATWQREGADTEDLRLTLQQYRSLLGTVVPR